MLITFDNGNMIIEHPSGRIDEVSKATLIDRKEHINGRRLEDLQTITALDSWIDQCG